MIALPLVLLVTLCFSMCNENICSCGGCNKGPLVDCIDSYLLSCSTECCGSCDYIATSNPTSSPIKSLCYDKYDVLFIIDESSTIDRSRFSRINNFVLSATSHMYISTSGVNVGLVAFSGSSQIIVDFTDPASISRQGFYSKVSSNHFNGGWTNLPLATLVALDVLDNRRPGVTSIVFVISDFHPEVGRSSTSSTTGGLIAVSAANFAKMKKLGDIIIQSVVLGNYAQFSSFAKNVSDVSIIDLNKPFNFTSDLFNKFNSHECSQ